MSRIAGLIGLLVTLLLLSATGGCGGGSGQSNRTEMETQTQSNERGGEASIEGFGEEASGAERAAVLAVFRGYLDALAKRDSAAACPYLSAKVQSSLEQLAGRQSGAGGCAAILPKLLAPASGRIAREEAAGTIKRVRVQGNSAFVVFHAPGARLYDLPMTREAGDWKVTIVSPPILAPSAETLGE
jgi:hypothetical protein